MATIKRLFTKMSRCILLMLIIVSLVPIVEGLRFGPFGRGNVRGFIPFRGGGGFGGLGPFGGGGIGGPFGSGGVGGLGPFGGGGFGGGGPFGFPINGTFPGLNVSLPALNDSFHRYPFPGLPSTEFPSTESPNVGG